MDNVSGKARPHMCRTSVVVGPLHTKVGVAYYPRPRPASMALPIAWTVVRTGANVRQVTRSLPLCLSQSGTDNGTHARYWTALVKGSQTPRVLVKGSGVQTHSNNWCGTYCRYLKLYWDLPVSVGNDSFYFKYFRSFMSLGNALHYSRQ